MNAAAESPCVPHGVAATRQGPFRGTCASIPRPPRVHAMPWAAVRAPQENRFNLKSKFYLRSLKHIKTSSIIYCGLRSANTCKYENVRGKWSERRTNLMGATCPRASLAARPWVAAWCAACKGRFTSRCFCPGPRRLPPGGGGL